MQDANQNELNQPMQTSGPSYAEASEDKQIRKPTTDEMLLAIYNNTRKTMNYMKWSLYITIVLVVLPLLAMIVLLPLVLKSLGTLGGIYGAGGVLSQ